MKISLGRHAAASGELVEAWIEPNRPAFRGGAVHDSGFLCIANEHRKTQLRLESTSEDSWTLVDAVGTALGRALWEERRRYDRTPYYKVHDHAQYGRIYFEASDSRESTVTFHTRPDGRYPREGVSIPEENALEQLRALFTHEHLARHHIGLVPDTSQIGEALAYGQEMVDSIFSARARYAAVVDWDFDNRLNNVMLAATGRKPLTDENDVERYEKLSSWAQRPAPQSFVTDSSEFYRWFEYGGKKRLEPLTSEQLTTYLREERGYPAEEAQRTGQMKAVSSEDWSWFKDKRLGLLREPVCVLHDLIRHEEAQPTPNRDWLDKAFKASDFCAVIPVSPTKVLGALQEFTQREQLKAVALANGPVYQKAVAAASLLQDPLNGLATLANHVGEGGEKLPGMWHESDLVGGATDCKPQAEERDDSNDFAP